MDFLLVINSNFGPIWHNFCDTATGDLLAEVCKKFPTTLSFISLAPDKTFRIYGGTFYRED